MDMQLLTLAVLLLQINHPLDCPICDQGGECDLQDQVSKALLQLLLGCASLVTQ